MSVRQPPTSATRAVPARTGVRRASAVLAAASIGLLVAGFVGATASPASAADATVNLGTAGSYAVLAGSTVTNTGNSMIYGDLGLSPGSSVTGFPPGQVVNGAQHVHDAAALQAQNDLTTAYNDAAGRPTSADVTGQDLGGMTLTPGVYQSLSSMGLTGTLTLNAQGNPDAVFIFQAGSTMIAETGSAVVLLNGASACNVFWQVGSSATLRTSSQFVGTIMALTSTTLETTATLQGRALARNGAVTLDDNVITAPKCATTPTATPTKKPTRKQTTKHHTTNTSKNHTPSTPLTPATPVIPTGHPSTGVGGMAHASNGTGGNGSNVYLLLAGLAGVAALVTALVGARPATIRRR